MYKRIYSILYLLHADVKKIIFWSVLLSALCGCGASTKKPTLSVLPGPYGSLTVEVYGFRTLQGDLLLSLFQKGSGFPGDSAVALVNLSAPVESGQVQLLLPPLPYGIYSYSLLHDENRNAKMDKSLLGTAREGYAFSNDPEGHYGPPEEAKAQFEIGPEPQHHRLRIHYFKRKNQGQRPF
jgi:uncharacterized protein (DUF2141 family)